MGSLFFFTLGLGTGSMTAASDAAPSTTVFDFFLSLVDVVDVDTCILLNFKKRYVKVFLIVGIVTFHVIINLSCFCKVF